MGFLTSLTLKHTWTLITTKRHFHRADVVVVDVASACFNVCSHTVGSRNIPGRKVPTHKRWMNSVHAPSYHSCFFVYPPTEETFHFVFHGSSANLVKTPEANPKVVLLALWITSSSVSKGSTDITGPKISSFTQVMSSVHLSVSTERTKCNTTYIHKRCK